MQIARPRRPSIALDMTPMIDCVFQLLIFFMLSSSFLTPALDLTLPEATTEDLPEQQEVIVSIAADGAVYVNQDRITLDALAARLTPLVAASETKTVTIRGDEQMKYELFVKALAAAESAGAAHVNVAHEAGSP